MTTSPTKNKTKQNKTKIHHQKTLINPPLTIILSFNTPLLFSLKHPPFLYLRTSPQSPPTQKIPRLILERLLPCLYGLFQFFPKGFFLSLKLFQVTTMESTIQRRPCPLKTIRWDLEADTTLKWGTPEEIWRTSPLSLLSLTHFKVDNFRQCMVKPLLNFPSTILPLSKTYSSISKVPEDIAAPLSLHMEKNAPHHPPASLH